MDSLSPTFLVTLAQRQLLCQSDQISEVHLVDLTTHFWCHICINEQTLGVIQMVGATFQFCGDC